MRPDTPDRLIALDIVEPAPHRESTAMSSMGFHQPRSPLSGEPSRPTSPSGSGAASPPYLRMHPSRAPHSPLAISTNLHVPSQHHADGRTPTSPGRAQTHRTLGHIPLAAAHGPSSVPAHPSHLHPPGRQNTSTPPPHVNHSTVLTPLAAPATTSSSYSQSLGSPCFVHSHLDHTLNDVVKRDGANAAGSPGADGTPRATRKKLRSRLSEYGQETAQAHPVGQQQPQQQQHEQAQGAKEGAPDPKLRLPESSIESGTDDDDDGEETSDDEKNTWTRQLAETAVSVREMSRQLGASSYPCLARRPSRPLICISRWC